MQCPDWCTATHDDHVATWVHETLVASVDSAGVFTYARQWENREYGPETPSVRAFARQGKTSTGVDLDAGGARTVAQIVENLGHGTAADHRAFADALRANAELIDPEAEAS